MGKVHVHALGINVGGGMVLLQQLLSQGRGLIEHCFLDKRIEGKVSFLNAKFFDQNLWSEYRSQKLLNQIVEKDDHILFFSNRPPLIKFKCRVSVFHQNALLIQKPNKSGLRHFISYYWVKLFAKNADQFIVQNNFMKSSVENILHQTKNYSCSVKIYPFFHENIEKKESEEATEDYIYVASSLPHKNHKVLLEAWRRLVEETIFKKLTLVFSDTPPDEVLSLISQYNLSELVTIKSKLSRNECLTLLGQHKSLIYPSHWESFGLPLIEADRAGLKLVTSEKDYVRDVVTPHETFDPSSSLSIYRAIKRNEEIENETIVTLSPIEFLKKLQENSLEKQVPKAS